MLGTFPPPPRLSVPWCMPGSVTSGLLWSRWRGKRSRYSRRMCKPAILRFWLEAHDVCVTVVEYIQKCTPFVLSWISFWIGRECFTHYLQVYFPNTWTVMQSTTPIPIKQPRRVWKNIPWKNALNDVTTTTTVQVNVKKVWNMCMFISCRVDKIPWLNFLSSLGDVAHRASV